MYWPLRFEGSVEVRPGSRLGAVDVRLQHSHPLFKGRLDSALTLSAVALSGTLGSSTVVTDRKRDLVILPEADLTYSDPLAGSSSSQNHHQGGEGGVTAEESQMSESQLPGLDDFTQREPAEAPETAVVDEAVVEDEEAAARAAAVAQMEEAAMEFDF